MTVSSRSSEKISAIARVVNPIGVISINNGDESISAITESIGINNKSNPHCTDNYSLLRLPLNNNIGISVENQEFAAPFSYYSCDSAKTGIFIPGPTNGIMFLNLSRIIPKGNFGVPTIVTVYSTDN